MKQATLGAGCFWGVEEVLQNVKGINATRVGYMGGDFENPTYEDVCSDQTGHVEVVEIEYDPAVVSYENLLSLFWRMHDPTSLNKQSAYEKGSQYGAVIFFNDEDQKAMAISSKEALEDSGFYQAPIVTEIKLVSKFWPAEEYHQKYIQKGGTHHCSVFNRGFAERETLILTDSKRPDRQD